MYKKNITKKILSEKVSKRIGFSKNLSLNFVDNIFTSLSSDLIRFNKIKLSSFGTFNVNEKKERTGRNPKTKKEAKIVARKVVKFKPSIEFKKKLNK